MLFLDLPFWESAFRGLMALLCRVIYPIISILYKLFMNITQIRILQSDQIEPIYQRITMILTIIMVFYITFQFVKYVVQPDTMTDKEKGAGNIVYKMVIVIILIAFVPDIFGLAYDVQKVIVKENVISKVIIGPQATNETDLGTGFSATIFSMFYSVDDVNENANCTKNWSCSNVVNYNISNLKNDNSLGDITRGLNATEDKESELPLIRFDGLLAVVVGGLILYVLVLYSIDVGARWAQLIYLQLISPIAILGYLSPKKDGIFQKWTKQCITTYLDLFLRIAIINIALLICDVLLRSFTSSGTDGNLLAELGQISRGMEIMIYIVLILGVLMFAHKAPKMLAELFPKGGAASGNFGLSAKDRGLKGATRVFGAAAGGAVGAVVGGAAGLAQGFRRAKKLDSNAKWYQKAGAGMFGATRGALGGIVGGAGRGIANGSKKGNVIKNVSAGAKNQLKASQRFGNREENGYGFMDQMGDRVKNTVGMRGRVEMLEEQKAPLKRYQDINEKIRKANSDMTSEAESQIKKGKGKYSGVLASAEKRLQNLQENQNFREEERNKIKASQTYRQKCDEIDNDVNNAGKTASEIKKLKDKVLESMTDEEVGRQLTEAQQAVKKAKDLAVFDFITNGEYQGTDANGNDLYGTNAKLESIRTALKTEITEYNKYNSNSNYAINAEQVEEAMTNGELIDSLIKGKKVRIPIYENGVQKIDAQGNPMYQEYDYTDDGITNKIDESQNRMVAITQHQEAIKRQTSGSGINEGKK